MKNKVFTMLAIGIMASFGLGAKPPKRKNSTKITYSVNDLKKNLQYDFAKSFIRSTYYDRLDQLAQVMVNQKYAVALRGFADSIGTYKGNWVLSQKRADAVKNYLVSKGVPAGEIVSTAFGSTEPVATNKTSGGRAKNRRVEIILRKISD